jgi:hypothetical protein
MWANDNPLGSARAEAARRRRMWRMAVTVALAAPALCFVLRPGAPAHAQSPIITAWLAANAECKGGHGDDAKTAQACKKRDQIGARLERRGCVYQEAGDWWKCPHR